MEAALRSFFRWVFRNPLVVAVVVLAVAILVAPQLLEVILVATLDRLLRHVLLPLIPLALIIWAILWILGYGRLWGKKKSK